ncbi:MAG: shikimate kinase [Spirochaetia bacterium]|nr:shikimate kinase [Spirochaetia bacterium]
MHSKIAILGFRGVGKSTVSRLLSKKTKFPLYVLDSEIESNEGRTITEIVEANDWNYFRDLELQYLRSQADREKLILDCGGGILEGHDGNFSVEKNEILSNQFFCVYLNLPDAKLLTRLEKIRNKSSRPVLQGDLKKILEKRKPWFEKIADFEVNTDGLTPYEVAGIIRKKVIK